MDRRILDFSSGGVALPEEFTALEKKRMIYACGDAFGGFTKTGNNMRKTNIEVFSKLGFNIFCCVGKSIDNIDYLTSKPELNVVLCIMTGNKDIDYPILENLFPSMLELISTDDTRFYPSAKVAFTMLKVGGLCEKVSRAYIIKGFVSGGRVYTGDFQWGTPNFSIEDSDKLRRHFILKKAGKTFNTSARFTNNIPNNISNNEKLARRLQNSFNSELLVNPEVARQSWVNWHTRRAAREQSKSKSGGKSRRNRLF